MSRGRRESPREPLHGRAWEGESPADPLQNFATESAPTELLRAGLELRVGHRLGLLDRQLFRWFIARGVPMPEGFAVCADCGLVFRPRRKRTASRCETCHKHPPPEWTFEAGRIVRPQPEFDAAGEFIGWRQVRWTRCSECAEWFEPKRRSAVTCSDKCRKARHDRRRRGDDAELSRDAARIDRAVEELDPYAAEIERVLANRFRAVIVGSS